MNINCQVSLSKKLRAIIGNSKTSLTLITNDLHDGKSNGKIILSIDSNSIPNSVLNDFIRKETSIMLTPTEITDSNDVYDTTNVSKELDISQFPEKDAVTNIFNNESNLNEVDENSTLRKIGAITPPKSPQETKYSVKPKQQIEKEIPKSFEVTQKPEVKRYITNINQLTEAIKLSENKKYNVDIDSITDRRKRAVALEEKEKAEAIDYPAFIVNDKCANLYINDLGISLSLNIPFNLNNISAKRLAESGELKAMIRSNIVKFISPDEAIEYVNKSSLNTDVDKVGLDVFSSHKEAERAIETKVADIIENNLSLKDLDGPSEEEKILRSLPSIKNNIEETEDGIIKTAHGSSNQSRIQKTISQEQRENKQGIKTIRRSGVQFE